MSVLFKEYPKTARLNREIVVTEKIDGTNAGIQIVPDFESDDLPGYELARKDGFALFAQSRSKLIKPGEDNHGFAGWVQGNADALFALGPGTHFGEWWGAGINKRYPGAPKKFSLFNTARWSDPATRPAIVDVVPVLYQGPFAEAAIVWELGLLRSNGSRVWPGAKAEGVCVFHTAANIVFKVTCEKDETWKGTQ